MGEIALGPAKPIKQCDAVVKLAATPAAHAQRGAYSGRTMSLSWQVTAFENALATALSQDEATHVANKEALEHNLAMRKHVEAVMAELGIGRQYQRRKKMRYGGLGKFEKVDAGYIGDLQVFFPVGDGWPAAQLGYDARLKALEIARAEAAKAKAYADGEAERKLEARRKDIALASMMIRYGLSEDSGWREALDAVCARDKYVRLAAAGQRVRIHGRDWVHLVANALHDFTLESETDKQIMIAWSSALGGDDHRDFRDCGEWGYVKVMALGVPELVKDAEACIGNIDD